MTDAPNDAVTVRPPSGHETRREASPSPATSLRTVGGVFKCDRNPPGPKGARQGTGIAFNEIVAFHLVPILITIRHELHVAFVSGRISATLDAALIAYGAYWKEHGRSREETRRLFTDFLASTGHYPHAARRGRELPAQDITVEILKIVVKPFAAEERLRESGIVLAL